jgi:hypothetical protein
MTVVTTTLYYDSDHQDEDYLFGRALTEVEHANITADEIRDAISHSMFWCELGLEDGPGMRPTPEAVRAFNALTIEQLKEALRKNNAILIRCNTPEYRNVFPVFTKGPRKGETNWKKEPQVFWDRWYLVRFLDEELELVEAKVFLHDNGTFSVAEEVAA